MAITLDDVRAQLGMGRDQEVGRTSSNVSDLELQPYLDDALAVCADHCGPVVVSAPITETYDGGYETIMLRQTPVAAIVSVTEYVGLTQYDLTSQPPGSTVNEYGYSLDDAPMGLLVRRSSSGMPQPFFGGSRSVVVVYTVGYSVIPANLARGIIILTQHLYGSKVPSTSQRPGGVSAGPSSTFAIPYRVLELWKKYLKETTALA